jgi:hypothetical protein
MRGKFTAHGMKGKASVIGNACDMLYFLGGKRYTKFTFKAEKDTLPTSSSPMEVKCS